MNTKICTKCKYEKSVSEFWKNKSGKFGVTTRCKECHKTQKTKERQLRLLKIPKGFKQCTKCKCSKELSEFHIDKTHNFGVRDICKICCSFYAKQYNKNTIIKRKLEYQKCKETRLKRNKEWRLKNIYKQREKDKIYSATHKDIRKKWREKNKKEISRKHNIWEKQQIKENPKFHILKNLRNRILSALNGKVKSKRTLELLGCNVEELKKYLESKFKDGMSWENHGKGINGKGMQEWHIDHIRPCASFDLSDPKQQEQCFHYTNLQPLWAKENLNKGDKYVR